MRRTEPVLADTVRELKAARDQLARDVTAMHDGINQTAREAYAARRQHRQALAEQTANADRHHAAWRSARRRAVEERATFASLAAAHADALTRAEQADTLAARLTNTRQYVDAAYEADMCEGVRGDLRRLLDGKPPTYAARVDPDEPIPYALTTP
ncbi:hypothetical protein ACXZ65_33910 [Streptomyces aculeolatus]